MAMIRLDVEELTAVARDLRSFAAETSAIASDLLSCVHCALPAAVASEVQRTLVTTRGLLDDLAGRTAADADDLLRRAGLAARDLLSAATAASSVSGAVPSGLVPLGGSPPEASWRTWGLPAGVAQPLVASPPASDFRTFGLPAGVDPETFRLRPSVMFPPASGVKLSPNQLAYVTNGTGLLQPMYTALGKTERTIHALNSPLTTTVRPGG